MYYFREHAPYELVGIGYFCLREYDVGRGGRGFRFGIGIGIGIDIDISVAASELKCSTILCWTVLFADPAVC